MHEDLRHINLHDVYCVKTINLIIFRVDKVGTRTTLGISVINSQIDQEYQLRLKRLQNRINLNIVKDDAFGKWKGIVQWGCVLIQVNACKRIANIRKQI